jgi:glycosyltransferase involved in cell wall biosynthesis
MHLRVRVGITDGADPGEPDMTRRFLRLHSPANLEICALSAAGALGFNELVAVPADVYVLLEGGALVGPDWFTHLLAALDRPGCGLAGPSSNRSWNEQSCVPRPRADLTGVRRDAALLATRFGSSARALAPLHSLGAFCYAVRREVVDTIGPADPAYGEGPCWEMDYNVRAARAGFTGLWVGAAYVYRPPAAARVQRRETGLLDRNTRLYQDRLCGLRLRNERTDYEPHCRGDACEHFAPADLVQVGPEPVATNPPPHPAARVTTQPREPLVSALMVTRDRPEFALQSVQYFLRQSYPQRELIIVEDGVPSLKDRLPRDPRITLVSTGLRRTIGAMRNQSCYLARGEVLVLWDDDDWHGPDRLATQVQPLLDGRTDITGLTDLEWLELDSWRCWQLDRPLQERMLLNRVYAGTLAFHRRVWDRGTGFANRSLAEDAGFLRQALERGARFQHLGGQGIYVYVRHAQNSWQVPIGTPNGWIACPPPELPASDIAFLKRARGRGTTPLVSCVMPTKDRRPWLGQAIEYFLRQDWPSRELVILDDGLEPVGDLVPDLPSITYHRLDRRTVLGAKRNLAVEIAKGDVIAHWDDDDWYSRHRLSAQVSELQRSGAALVGTPSLAFYDPARAIAWRYGWPSHRRPWLAGTSLLFRRELWQRNRFAEVANGEDTRFVWRTPAAQIAGTPDPHCIAVVHPGNTVPKTGRGAYWTREPVAEVEAMLGTDLTFYESLLANPRQDQLVGEPT